MELKGSCHCGRIEFKVASTGPYPFMICLCSICRKTQGGGGYSIYILGTTDTMQIKGKEHIVEYVATEKRPGKGSKQEIKRTAAKDDKEEYADAESKWEPFSTDEESSFRAFCDTCHAGLWYYAPEDKQRIYPFASAIDTELPAVPKIDGKDGRIFYMKNSMAAWVPLPLDAKVFDEHPDIGLESWHKKHNLAQ